MLHAQLGCVTQVKPVPPLSAGIGAVALCLCAQNNTGCHWQWATPPPGQPAPVPYPPPMQADTSIYRITPPAQAQPMSLLDMAIKAEQIRALRLENQQREQEMNQQEIQRGTAPATVLPLPIPAPPIVPPSPSQSPGAVGQSAKPVEKTDSAVSTWRTAGWWNGRLWKTLSASERITFLAGYSDATRIVATAASPSFERFDKLERDFWPGSLTLAEVCSALDRFYETPENGPISIWDAITVIARRSSGTDEATLQKAINELRAQAGR